MKITILLFVALILLLSASACFAQESKLKIYGYFDLEAEVNNKNAVGKIWTFDQHHLNIITIYHLDDHFRVFTEVEWGHGTSVEAGGERSGAIRIERVWLEYKYSDLFKVKTGKFLTPFGIYNLKHHATPTFLSTLLPTSVYGEHENTVANKQRLFARYATGIQVLGTVHANDWEVDYHAYLSNGRGPKPDERDNNANKGIGGRVIVIPPIELLRLGLSYYADKDGNSYNTRQSALGFDVALDYLNALVEAELILPRGEKVDTTNTPTGNFQEARGYYVMGAYTFFDRVTPFARHEFFDPDIDKDNDGETIITLGINYSFSPKVYLKNEIHFHRLQNPAIRSFEMYVGSIAVAF